MDMSSQAMLRLAFKTVESLLEAKAQEEYGDEASVGSWSYDTCYDHFDIQVDVPGEMYYQTLSIPEEDILGEEPITKDYWP